MANYDVGDTIRFTGTFTDINGAAADPTTVTLKVKSPSGITSTFTYALSQLVKDSIGVYHYDFALNEIGTWFYRFEGTGTVAQATESSVYVQPTAFYT